MAEAVQQSGRGAMQKRQRRNPITQASHIPLQDGHERYTAIRLDCRGSRKVNPALVVADKEGKPFTVRYDAVNAMLLNEFLKEH